MSGSWREVTTDSPCPACHKPDWCAWTRDGWLKCERSTEPPSAMRLVSRKGGGALFRPPTASKMATPIRNAGKGYTSLVAALKSLARKCHRPVDHLARYPGGTFCVARFDVEDADGQPDKFVRPLHLADGRWHIGDPPGPLPLYHGDELGGDGDLVVVLEGEPKTDDARTIGLVAVSPAHGSQSPHLTCWSPLAGRRVAILPDHDEPGEMFAAKVAELLLALNPPADPIIVRLPELGPSEDIADFIERRRLEGKDAAAIRREVLDLVDHARARRLSDAGAVEVDPCHTASRTSRDVARSYPTASLPEPLRSLVQETADALPVLPEAVALPAIVMAAAALGLGWEIRLKEDWREPAILWGALVARSGGMKSPAFHAALGPLTPLERRWRAEHAAAAAEHARTKRRKHAEGGASTQEEPPDPTMRRLLTSDPTLEALAGLLEANPRGILVARDELDGFFQSFDKYRSSRGADRAAWLELHRAGPLRLDRKTQRSFLLPRAGAWVIGTIQPEIFEASMRGSACESGLAARFLVAAPELPAWQWTDRSVSRATLQEAERLVSRLADLPHTIDPSGAIVVRVIDLEPDALRLFKEAANALGLRTHLAGGAVERALAKFRGVVARLALVLHAVRIVGCGGLLGVERVSHSDMEVAIAVAAWHEAEAIRVFSRLDETREETGRRRALEQAARDGHLSARSAMRAAGLGTAEEAQSMIDELVRIGWLGPGQCISTGGRPTVRYPLLRTAP